MKNTADNQRDGRGIPPAATVFASGLRGRG